MINFTYAFVLELFFAKWIVLSCHETMGKVYRKYFFVIDGCAFVANLLDFVLIFFEKRTPEWILHFFTLFGEGTVNVLLMIFCHRSLEDSYHENLVLCCTIHITVFIFIFCCFHEVSSNFSTQLF